VTRLPRFRFSLMTLLLAITWSGVVAWMNVTPRLDFSCFTNVEYEDNGLPPESWSAPGAAEYGWPWAYGLCCGLFHPADELPRLQMGMIGRYRALAGDVAVGVLLVAVLTWGSSQLLRRVGARLRRRPASKPGEQQTLRSRGE
jgi:hypothetical protein